MQGEANPEDESARGTKRAAPVDRGVLLRPNGDDHSERIYLGNPLTTVGRPTVRITAIPRPVPLLQCRLSLATDRLL